MILIKGLFCFIFGAAMRLILRSKWYGPGLVVFITVISALLAGSASLWIEAIGCSILAFAGSFLGVHLARLFKINLFDTEDAVSDDEIENG